VTFRFWHVWREHRRSVEHAQELTDKVRAQQPEVDRIVAELRKQRRENHFAAKIQRAFGGR
jgi:hypothetical protein